MKLHYLAFALVCLSSLSLVASQDVIVDDVIVYDYDVYGYLTSSDIYYQPLFYDTYIPFWGCLPSYLYAPYDCCYSVNAFCYYYARKNDTSGREKYRKIVEKHTKNEKSEKKELSVALKEELAVLKKEILKEENGTFDEFRKNKNFNKEWLLKQLQVNKILQLEKFINEKNEKK